VDGSESFYLFYAPWPYQGPETIGSIDMGTLTSISAPVPHGFSYYFAIRGNNSQGMGDYSNGRFFKTMLDSYLYYSTSQGALKIFIQR